eukprot:359416-Chlamydomonas_euryale.AAC.12
MIYPPVVVLQIVGQDLRSQAQRTAKSKLYMQKNVPSAARYRHRPHSTGPAAWRSAHVTAYMVCKPAGLGHRDPATQYMLLHVAGIPAADAGYEHVSAASATDCFQNSQPSPNEVAWQLSSSATGVACCHHCHRRRITFCHGDGHVGRMDPCCHASTAAPKTRQQKCRLATDTGLAPAPGPTQGKSERTDARSPARRQGHMPGAADRRMAAVFGCVCTRGSHAAALAVAHIVKPSSSSRFQLATVTSRCFVAMAVKSGVTAIKEASVGYSYRDKSSNRVRSMSC